MEPDVKTVQDYVAEVANRFGQLTQEEAQDLMGLYGTPQLVTISKVLGPEVSSVLGEAMNTIANALEPQAVPVQTAAAMPAEQPVPMAKSGLVSRRKKPVAKKK